MIETIANIKKKFFLHKFIDDYRVGAAFPSSYFLVKKVRSLLPNNMSIVIEQGAGNGVMTRELLKKISPDGKLFVIEQNQHFIDVLCTINDPRIVIVCGLAQDFDYKKYVGEKSVDLVISSIPFSFLKEEERSTVCENAYRNLVDGGMFIIFHQYLVLNLYLPRLYIKLTSIVLVSLVIKIRNLL